MGIVGYLTVELFNRGLPSLLVNGNRQVKVTLNLSRKVILAFYQWNTILCHHVICTKWLVFSNFTLFTRLLVLWPPWWRLYFWLHFSASFIYHIHGAARRLDLVSGMRMFGMLPLQWRRWGTTEQKVQTNASVPYPSTMLNSSVAPVEGRGCGSCYWAQWAQIPPLWLLAHCEKLQLSRCPRTGLYFCW